MKVILVLTIFLSLFSCSTQTKNMISTGEQTVKGGVYRNEKWQESLIFKRYSWYKEMTLLFDALIVPVPTDNSFSKWLSDTEKSYSQSCQSALVVVTYFLDSKRLSYTMFKDQMKAAGYEEFSLDQFGKHLKLHPDFETLSLTLYKVQGFCRKGSVLDSKPVIAFPGFSEISL